MESNQTHLLDLNRINFQVPVAKRLWLAKWVKGHLQESSYSSVQTSQLFDRYLGSNPTESVVTEAQFCREIEPLMRAFGWNVFRTRNTLGRGYAGVTFLNTDRPKN